MNHHHLKRSAIKLFLSVALLAFLSVGNAAFAAQVAATVTRLSGPLMAKKANGSVKILSVKSEVEEGDTLVTEKNTYAQIKFIDNSEVTLKPSTTFKVESFAFDDGKPDADSATLNLVKGGLRSVTGLLGKRNKEKFALKTPTATIGIRGTTFIADYIEPTEEGVAALEAYNLASTAALGAGIAPIQPLQLAQLGVAPKAPALPPGLYVSVIDGAISLANRGGTTNFAAGQFGYTANIQAPPVVVPANPALKFTPPPTFSQTSNKTGASSGKAAAVDCEVR
jgi:hypothetical protein